MSRKALPRPFRRFCSPGRPPGPICPPAGEGGNAAAAAATATRPAPPPPRGRSRRRACRDLRSSPRCGTRPCRRRRPRLPRRPRRDTPDRSVRREGDVRDVAEKTRCAPSARSERRTRVRHCRSSSAPAAGCCSIDGSASATGGSSSVSSRPRRRCRHRRPRVQVDQVSWPRICSAPAAERPGELRGDGGRWRWRSRATGGRVLAVPRRRRADRDQLPLDPRRHRGSRGCPGAPDAGSSRLPAGTLYSVFWRTL